MKLYSAKNCPPCLRVKSFIEHFKIEDKIETIMVTSFEEMPQGARGTPCLQLGTGGLVHNSQAIIDYLTEHHLK